ncbi:MAG: LamG-like jellyroll fold domain-containing protein [Chloroflexota bacterium]
MSVRLTLCSTVLICFVSVGMAVGALSGSPAQARDSVGLAPIQHYLYAVIDGTMFVYDIDQGHKLVKTISLPQTVTGIRGIAASPSTGSLYISYGSDKGAGAAGSMLKYDLVHDTVVWSKDYNHGIDSMAISNDGQKIYMPDGEASTDGTWYIEDANTGNDIGSINAGLGPHNTVMGPSGKYVYLGARNYNFAEVADTSTNQVVQKVGPLQSGVRPFTINGAETLVYTSLTGFLGFQVGDLVTGKVLYTVPIQGFTWNPATFDGTDPSHGISLSPDGKELYVIDAPNSYVHVFDVSGVPSSPPKQVADIPLTKPMTGGEGSCAYDCGRGGWLLHSYDGRYVYVGDEGDVIDTTTRTVVTNLPQLYDTKKFIEVDFQNGVPIDTTTRIGMGRAAGSSTPTSTPAMMGTPAATPTATGGACSTPAPTHAPTDTPAATSTATAAPSNTPTNTPVPTSTAAPNTAPTNTPVSVPSATAVPYASAVLADHPAIYYRLDESCGTTAADSSGNGRDGSYSESATLDQGGATNDGDAAISTTGRGLQYRSGAGLPTGPAPRAVEAWFKTTTSPNNAVLAAWGTESGDNLFAFMLYNATTVKLTDWDNNYFFPVPAGANVADGQWHYLAGVFDGTTVTMYYDGQNLGSQSGTFDTTLNGAGMVVGSSTGKNDYPYTGAIDEVAVYDTALSVSQVQAHYNANAAVVLTTTPTVNPTASVVPTPTPTATAMATYRPLQHRAPCDRHLCRF